MTKSFFKVTQGGYTDRRNKKLQRVLSQALSHTALASSPAVLQNVFLRPKPPFLLYILLHGIYARAAFELAILSAAFCVVFDWNVGDTLLIFRIYTSKYMILSEKKRVSDSHLPLDTAPNVNNLAPEDAIAGKFYSICHTLYLGIGRKSVNRN
ncbi:hypothetical protein RCL_jg18348.t1 [Rhizophagus clarus]|uniref:Uncharacterized protein n=1 Tax=Rhizophagus clarus TaxID=94130 RepID=A0A8H3QNG1_9GLOM|nr:hypothetical protein RCL_jg18348.t1 [Rhizophagus clarus]